MILKKILSSSFLWIFGFDLFFAPKNKETRRMSNQPTNHSAMLCFTALAHRSFYYQKMERKTKKKNETSCYASLRWHTDIFIKRKLREKQRKRTRLHAMLTWHINLYIIDEQATYVKPNKNHCKRAKLPLNHNF